MMPPANRSKIRRIVLVHGAAHGAWCWERLVPLLENKGYEVDALNLPGLGNDPTPPEQVTLRAYVDRVIAHLTAKAEPALLVGHSMAGVPISQAAEDVPEAVAKLIYIAAALPLDGESLFSIMDSMPAPDGPSVRDCMRPSADGLSFEFAPEAVHKTFYNACPPDIAEHAMRRLRPQATAPLATPLHLTPSRWGAIPKTYIVCARDQTLPAIAQHWSCERVPGVKKRVMDTDHSPFYSDPQALADMIDDEAV